MNIVIFYAPQGLHSAPALLGSHLRSLLAHEWAVPEAALAGIALTSGVRGNPLGVVPGAGQLVECSRSLSAPWGAGACLGPGEAGWLGVDIEDRTRFGNGDPHRFAELVLGGQEIEWFRRYRDAGERTQWDVLARAWVRKEAVVKAMHTGFAHNTFGLVPAAIECTDPADPQPVCLTYPWIDLVDCATDPAALASLAYNPSGR